MKYVIKMSVLLSISWSSMSAEICGRIWSSSYEHKDTKVFYIESSDTIIETEVFIPLHADPKVRNYYAQYKTKACLVGESVEIAGKEIFIAMSVK